MAKLPPDARAVGTPDPAGDMDNVVDALAVITGATPGGPDPGTGTVTAQKAINALAAAVTNNQVLAGNGTNITLRALAAADLPAATTSLQGAVILDGTAADIAIAGAQAAGAVGKAADAGHIHPACNWVPGDNGLLAAAAPLDAVTAASGALTAGTVYLSKVPIRQNITAATVWWTVSTAAAGASTGTLIGLYNSSGSLLANSSTGEIGAKFTTTGPQSAAFTASQSLTGGTFVWAVLIVNFATTQPGVRCYGNNLASMVNLGLTAATFRCATNGTGQTALPASFTPSANAQGAANSMWFGFS